MRRRNREFSVAKEFDNGIDCHECELFHNYDKMERPKQKFRAFMLAWTAGSIIIMGVSIASLIVTGMNVLGILGLGVGLAANIATITSIKELRDNDEVRNLRAYKEIKRMKKNGSWEKIRQAVAEVEMSVAINSSEDYSYTKGTQVITKKEELSFGVEDNDIKSL